MAKRAEYLGPERRRPLVLDAALEIFADGGFADASMSAIATRAGVSKAVLYDCFPGGKQEIYYAMLDRGGQGFLEHILGVFERTNKMPLEEGLLEAFNSFIAYATEHPLEFRILFGDAGTADREIAQRAASTREQLIAKIGERTREIMETAGLPYSPLAQVYNRVILATAEELSRWTLNDPTISAREVVRAVVNWFVHGFAQTIPSDTWRKPSRALEHHSS